MDLRKTIFLAFILILILSGSGCSDGDAERAKETSASTQNTGLPPATLTFLITGDEKDDSREVLDTVAEKSGLNIKLDFKYFSEMYAQQVWTYIESGQKFDALYVGMPESYEVDGKSYSYVEMARNGALKDITDLLPEFAPHLTSQFDKKELEASKIDGKLYAVPSNFPEVKNMSISVNPELVRKYDIGPVNTFEDYGVFLKTIKDNEKNIIPGQVSYFDQELFMFPYGYALVDNALSLVCKWDDPDRRIIPWERTDEFKNVVHLLSDWQKNGYLARYDDGIEKERASFLNLSGAVKDGPSNMTFGDNKSSRKYEFYSYMMYRNVKIPRPGPIGNIYMKGAIALSADSANAERTLMFLDWVQSSQENYDLLMYGIKDRHYTLEGERLVFPVEEGEGYPSYYHWLNSPFRNFNYARASVDDEFYDGGIGNDFREYIANRTFPAPNAGFYPDYRDIGAESERRVQLYQDLITYSLFEHAFDPSRIDSVIRKLTEAGTDAVVAEVQRQFDEWRAK